jgi:hypothetical protein
MAFQCKISKSFMAGDKLEGDVHIKIGEQQHMIHLNSPDLKIIQ